MTVPARWFDASRVLRTLGRIDPVRLCGSVVRTAGLLIESQGPAAAVGDFCEVVTRAGAVIRTQVIGFRDGRILSMPLEETTGLQPGDVIIARPEAARVRVSSQLLGRVLDGFGQPMDGGPPIESAALYDLYAPPPRAAGARADFRTAGDRHPRY